MTHNPEVVGNPLVLSSVSSFELFPGLVIRLWISLIFSLYLFFYFLFLRLQVMASGLKSGLRSHSRTPTFWCSVLSYGCRFFPVFFFTGVYCLYFLSPHIHTLYCPLMLRVTSEYPYRKILSDDYSLLFTSLLQVHLLQSFPWIGGTLLLKNHRKSPM